MSAQDLALGTTAFFHSALPSLSTLLHAYYRLLTYTPSITYVIELSMKNWTKSVFHARTEANVERNVPKIIMCI